MYQKKFMEEAIKIAGESIVSGGGPFGAVVVRDGKIIARASNRVTKNNDPTAHAEINAIREACAVLGNYQLSGCEIYCSCEPCPMCLGAIYWARPERVYYAATQMDAAGAGFDDSFIYREILLPHEKRTIPFIHKIEKGCGHEFILWGEDQNKIEY